MASTTESKIEDFAEELGKLLGTARNKAEHWLRQRQEITKTLEGIRDEAASLLSQLGERAQAGYRRGRAATAAVVGRRGPGRPPKAAASDAPRNGRRRRRALSAEARARISAAQKARWAKHRAAKKR